MDVHQAHHRVRPALADAGGLRRRLPRRLVEAFVPARAPLPRADRPGRAGLRGRARRHILVGIDLERPRRRRGPRRDRGRGHDRRRRPDGLPVGPGPGLRASAACCSSPSGASRAGSPRSPARPPRCPGTEAERQASTRGLDHTEVYPLLMFAVGGMMLFPAASDLLTLFVALEVLSLPLYLLCGLARRRRLLSQEAALKYFLLGAFSSGFFLYGVALVYGFAGSMEFAAINEAVRNDARQPVAAADRHGHARRSACCSRSAPCRSRPGPPTSTRAPRPRSRRSWPPPPRSPRSARMLRLFYVAFGSDRWTWQPMLWVIAILTMVVGAVLAVVQTDVKRMLAYSSVAHTGFLLTGVLGVQSAADAGRRPDHLAAGGAVLPGHLRLRDARRLRRRHRWSATPAARRPVLPLGRPGQALAAGGRRLRVLPALDGRHPADRGLHRQVGGLHGRPVGRRLAGRDRRRSLSSIVAVFFYVRVIVLMYFAEPRGRARGVVTHALAADLRHDRRRRRRRPSCSASCPARCSTSPAHAGEFIR